MAKPLMGVSIRAKLIATIVLPMVAVIVLFTAVHSLHYRRILDEGSARLRDRIADQLQRAGGAQLKLLAHVSRLALLHSDFTTLQAIIHDLALNEELLTAVAVVDVAGTVVAHSDVARVGEPATGLLRELLRARRSEVRSNVIVEGRTSVAFAAPVEQEGKRLGTIFLAFSLKPLEDEVARAGEVQRREVNTALWIALGVGLIALAFGVGLTVAQGVRLTRPIRELAQQADKMAAGNLEARVAVRSGDEIGRLGERFNYMAEQMYSLMQDAIAKATMEKELELAEAGKLAAIGRLAAGVAHEVNNPLTYVKGNLQMLARELEGDEELASLARDALHGVGRIQSVIQHLSEFARTTRGDVPGRVHVAAESAAKMAMVQMRDRASLEVEVADDLPAVTMDEGKLAQVLLNLLVNAAQAIEPGKVESNFVRLRARRVGDVVEVGVQDTGSGIPDEALPHIFESFFTTKSVGQGSGLGLSISRTFVKNAGGKIWAENATGGGARFVLQLPVHQEEGTAPEPSIDSSETMAAPQLTPRRRLLLVDDDPSVLRALERDLTQAFIVETATSGREALRLLEVRDDFDVILCDVMMPEGSGLDVVDALSHRPSVLRRLVLMTGGAPGREKALRDPSVPVLGKPFGVRDLLRLLAEQGEKREVADASSG